MITDLNSRIEFTDSVFEMAYLKDKLQIRGLCWLIVNVGVSTLKKKAKYLLPIFKIIHLITCYKTIDANKNLVPETTEKF